MKILIANRGEIAVRIIRACRTLGIRPVAVYCQGEEKAMHVQLADEAYCLGPPIAGFLQPQRLARLAKEAGAQAIHPGYGFLSENAGFARACRRQGIIFIGPSPQTLELAGHKVMARRLVARAGIPVIPGSEAVRSVAAARKQASKLGYPVMLKSAYGGGGKGMKIASSRRQLDEFFPLVRQESMSSFGKAEIFLEKFIPAAQHVEVQILCDSKGHAVHLGERNCSVQRRNQKLLEESPSPRLGRALREALTSSALCAARLFRYEGAGTVEFLVDRGQRIYFMEVNARIQVEHPVTEAVTGLDIVAEQIRIASGAALRTTQKDIAFHGHAVECRIYAEDPFDHFLPCSGIVDYLCLPQGPGIRVDTALVAGAMVATHYDPLLAKIIAHGASRQEALARMRVALEDFMVSPLRTTAPILLRVLSDKRFLMGQWTVPDMQRLDLSSVSPQTVRLGLLLAALVEERTADGAPVTEANEEVEILSLPKRQILNPWMQWT